MFCMRADSGVEAAEKRICLKNINIANLSLLSLNTDKSLKLKQNKVINNNKLFLHPHPPLGVILPERFMVYYF